MLSSNHVLALGGGGNFAIYLDEALKNGTSGICGTFSSPSLVDDPNETFLCVECELYVMESI